VFSNQNHTQHNLLLIHDTYILIKTIPNKTMALEHTNAHKLVKHPLESFLCKIYITLACCKEYFTLFLHKTHSQLQNILEMNVIDFKSENNLSLCDKSHV